MPEVVHQRSPGQPFQRGIRREDESTGGPEHIRHFVDEDIGRAALPSLVLVKGPAGLLEAYFLDELVGALDKGLDVTRGAHGAGHDGALRTRIRVSRDQDRQDEDGGQTNQDRKRLDFHSAVSLPKLDEIAQPIFVFHLH